MNRRVGGEKRVARYVCHAWIFIPLYRPSGYSHAHLSNLLLDQ